MPKKDFDDLDVTTLMNLLLRGVITINEVREKMGLEPIAGGDNAFIMTADGAVLVMEFDQTLDKEHEL